MCKNFWRIDFSTDLQSFMNRATFVHREWNKKMKKKKKKNAWGTKINLSLDQKIILLQKILDKI